jgi:protein gp37
MADRSAIEWTEATWNPVTGCDRVSAGCDHCYAMTLAKRLKAMGSAKYQNDGDPRTSGPGFGITVHPQALDEPTRWRTPRVVFVNSMRDLSVGVSSNLGTISTGQRHCLHDRQVSGTAPLGLAA